MIERPLVIIRAHLAASMAAIALLVPLHARAVERLDFSGTLQMALERSPTLNSVKRDVEISELEYKNAFSTLLPSLDFSTTAGYQDSRPRLSPSVWSSEYSLALSENLYDNGVSLTTLNSAKLRKDISDLTFRDQRDQLLLSVASEYMQYSLAKALYETQQRQFDIVNKQYRSVESQFQQGVRTRRDYLKFKTEVRRSEIEVESARTSIQKSEVELMKLLGYDQKDVTPFEFTPIEIAPKKIEQVPTAKPDITGHYQYRIADLQKRILENDVKIVRRRDLPELNVTAGANYHRGDYLGLEVTPVENDITTWNALVNLKFNIWDWGSRRRSISIAEAKKAQTENSLSNQLNSFSAESVKLMLDLQQSSKNFALANELLDLETKSYEYMNTDYRNGKVSYLDVVVGLRDLLNAQVQMDSTYFELRQQLLKYRYYEGRLYESLF